MAAPEQPASGVLLGIMVVFSPAPRQIRQWAVQLPAGSSVAQALGACSLFSEFPELLTRSLQIGIWGRKTRLDHRVCDSDRIEIYRPLRVDPKVARRERFDRQGVKSAGLFTKKRPGAKAGY